MPVGRDWVEETNLFGIWMLRKKVKGWSKVLPIIIRINQNSDNVVTAYSLGLDKFIPYSNFLLKLADRDFDEYWLGDNWDSVGKIESFLKHSLTRLTYNDKSLVFAEAQNSRLKWNWLQDGRIKENSISFDGCNTFEKPSELKNLKVVRVRNSSQREVPQHIALDLKNSETGNTAGVFKLNESVFYSLAERPLTAQKASQKVSKSENATKLVWNANIVEIIPCFLQNEDSVEEFVHFSHELRSAGITFSEKISTSITIAFSTKSKGIYSRFYAK